MRAITPIRLWASLGAVFLAAELFWLTRWVTSPSFTPVDSGPDLPPTWMRVTLIVGQVLFVAGALVFLYKLLWVPWRRERRVTLDGLLCIAALLASPFDMLSNYRGYWFTYNSYQLNMGSIMSALPGVAQPHGNGAGEAWPIVLIPGAYVVIFVGLAIVGCRLMNAAKRRWPGIGPVRLVMLCYVATMLMYLVIDGIICMPLGFWQFGGGFVTLLNGDTYYKYPLQEMITAGAVFTIFTCWRFFRNDRGETVAERGLNRLTGSEATRTVQRGLALYAVVMIGMVLTYHLPNGLLAAHATVWPKDVQARSYFTNNVCAEDTGRPCPPSR
ncbi:MAG TPA: spirocyclase AveC family protein [Pseudonocardia sp.]|jgi:hypothetical protein|nr:spirocyclase AveC family protein [Pseudonocardia sp.]